eukprot:TRINITY_DN8745_c0_g1_i1.p1 TRINITY_DN8745_c0_g1~~TRINITY_DN8745_c0_g1_i1.p1  ORF type:complete len:1205 (+),score=292.26 TRINITY_DN8745_c0_g1_i1:68-3616(+)
MASSTAGKKQWVGSSKLILDSQLYAELPVWQWVNVIPFLLADLAAFYFLFNYSDEYEVLSYVAIFLTIAVHLIALLFPQWSVDVNCAFTHKKVSQPSLATKIKIVPSASKGVKELCDVHHVHGTYYFLYQQRKYSFDNVSGHFKKLAQPPNISFREYVEVAKSDRNADWVSAQKELYGENKFTIPAPSFKKLYMEHMLAPFFVFQLFCVSLWFLDEYWYYSLFILFMLLVFEATVVKSRIKNLEQLRNMLPSPTNVNVLRTDSSGTQAWATVLSHELVPGDVVYFKREEEEVHLPCDMIVLSGSCITNEAMLTGESTPQMKEPVLERNASELLVPKSDSIHMLFGGTKLVQSSSDARNRGFGKAPDNVVVAYVFRTGFNTSQGKLVRTILYSTQRVTSNSFESFAFILFLLSFALAAAGYVLAKGLEDENRSRYKLIVECALIITSVVPPELPTELSLAVNTSLLALQKQGIFCTEPFRIPFAGKIDVCCFDKTGTLTEEDLVLQGVAVSSVNEVFTPKQVVDEPVAKSAVLVMGGCHSLTHYQNETIGNPMEVESLSGIGWEFNSSNIALGHSGAERTALHIRHRYHFSSSLARMSTIVSRDQNPSLPLLALVKGAPEVIMERLVDPPSNFEEIYTHFARRGKRVIALAYKELPKSVRVENVKNLSRDEVECDLTYAGFTIFECPVKPDSENGIQMLLDSSHRTVMITGDNPLTAAHVARELKIASKPVLILENTTKKGSDGEGQSWKWIPAIPSPEYSSFPFNNGSLASLSALSQFDFCLYGDGLEMVLNHSECLAILLRVNVMARARPHQKTQILSKLKEAGKVTLMAGDGSNDVGALKQSHVGVALLNNVKEEKKEEPKSEVEDSVKEKKSETDTGEDNVLAKLKNKKKRGAKNAPTERKVKAPKIRSRAQARTLQEKLDQLKAEMEENDPRNIQLGDASIASPFTSKSSSILSVAKIIRQGRCTLVTTYQMFRILALTSLINAYGMSVLNLAGIKLGDTQMTITGMLIAFCFLFVTRASPVEQLSKKRPLPKLFTPYMFLSVIGQFVVHISALIYLVSLAEGYREGPQPTPDDEFEPNLVNSVVFLIMTAMQVVTFFVNYEGRPFMQSMKENKGLYYSLLGCFAIVVVTATEILPDFNETFELVPYPSELRPVILMVLSADLVSAFAVERVARFLFY